MTSSNNNNMYRVGDYVYFEIHAGQPYQIRRIEELSRTQSGNQVEVKVMCFFRRRDIPSSLIHMADKHYHTLEEEDEIESTDTLTDDVKHCLRHRELFLTRQMETVPAQYIRGKCSVYLLSEVEAMSTYLEKEDSFFYTLVYDSVQRTLLADRGEIRVGTRFQADIPSFAKDAPDMPDERKCEDMESLQWDPYCKISNGEIDRYLIMSKSVGTFARALDPNNMLREPSLHMSAAAASRDITVFHAMDLLHQNDYVVHKAMLALVPESGPLLCRDQMEEWSASEANLFEEALEKYGKDFFDIRKDFLPWKSMCSIIEYYYMWKTTDRYMRQNRIKAADNENKLKQVYIPTNGNYNNPNKLASNAPGPKVCEGCACMSSSAWYLWGPNNMCKLCEPCWIYWKKFGGLKKPTAYEGGAQSSASKEANYECSICGKSFYRQERFMNHMGSHSEFKCTVKGCEKEFKNRTQLQRHLSSAHNLFLTSKDTFAQTVKARAPFMLATSKLAKCSRLCCKEFLVVKRLSRRPLNPSVDVELIEAKMKGMTSEQLSSLPKLIKPHVDIEKIISKVSAYSKSPAATARKRAFEESTLAAVPPVKRAALKTSQGGVIHKRFNWNELKANVLFVANERTRAQRTGVTFKAQKRAARRTKEAVVMKEKDVVVVE